MKSEIFSAPVYALYPGPVDGPADVERVVAALCGAGVGAIQYREMRLRDDEMLSVARRVVAAAAGSGVLVLVNDRADLALLARADGVHLGSRDLPQQAARALLGPGALVGVSVDTAQEALRAESDGADYVSLGPAYATATKTDVPEPRSLDLYRRLSERLHRPLVAIGGIRPDNVAPLAAAGVDSAACLSWLYQGADIGRQVRLLSQAFRSASAGARVQEGPSG